jgi:hypothetical protein
MPHLVITGLVPVIPMMKSAVLQAIEVAGTRPAITGERASRHLGKIHLDSVTLMGYKT